MPLTIPERFAERAAAFGESSYGVNRVTLVLVDGRCIRGVLLAWGSEIIKIGDAAVATSEDIDFALSDITDIVSEMMA